MPGERTVTLRNIAEAAGVSVGTVSLVLNGKNGIAPSTRQRVLGIARELGYERTQRRAPGKARTISVVIEQLPVSPMSDPFNKQVLLAIETAASRHGYRMAVEFVRAEESPGTGRWSPETAAGLIILGGGDLGPDWLRTAAGSGVPVVVADHFVPGLRLPAIVPDNLGGAYAATRFLIEMGHERIGFIRGPSKYWTLSERLAGYMLAMQQRGLGPDLNLIPPRVSHGDEKGYGEMRALLALPDRPSAVFAVSDKAAVGAYKAALEEGLSIPNDVSIMGFDDIEAGRALTPRLTTVHNPGDLLGDLAFERLLDLIGRGPVNDDAPLKWTFPMELVHRDSVKDRRSS